MPGLSQSLADFRRLRPFVRPYRWRIAFVFGVGLIATAFGLAQPYLSKMLVDRGLLGRDYSALAIAALLMVAFTVVSFALNMMSSLQYVELSALMLFDMRSAALAHLQTLSPRFFARTKMGEIVSRLNNDLGEVQRVAADVPMSAVTNGVFLVGSLVLMIWLNAKLLLISIALVPISLWLVTRYQNRLSTDTRRLRTRSADLGSILIETLTMMRLVALAGAGRRELERFASSNKLFIEALMRLQKTSILLGAFPGTLVTVSTAAVFLYGGKLILDGELTIGGLVAYMAYHTRLMAPVQNLLSLANGLTAAKVSLERLLELLDTKPEVADSPNAAQLESVRGDITFRSVSFRHEDDLVLDEFSFSVPAGKFCALVGPSGAGKSTIAELLVRFYDPESGAVLLDGRDLRTVKLADLRRHVALVDQHPVLLNASVADNIRFGRPEATLEEVADVAALAGVAHLLGRQIAGERGLALSAGERHRIAIARALLREASVYVFDEPTAALDPDMERSLISGLQDRLRGRTVICITHRAALAAAAEQTIFLERDKTAA